MITYVVTYHNPDINGKKAALTKDNVYHGYIRPVYDFSKDKDLMQEHNKCKNGRLRPFHSQAEQQLILQKLFIEKIKYDRQQMTFAEVMV